MSISSVVLAPVQAFMRRSWALQYQDLPYGNYETYRTTGFVVDNSTYPGHPRIIFGTLEEPMSDLRCMSPLVPDPIHAYDGFAHFRYFFPGVDKYTFLPDSEKLFSWRSEIAPMLSWRVRANEHAGVAKLIHSLRFRGYDFQANELEKMCEQRTIILVAQLNRTWVKLYGLGISPSDGYHYQAICYTRADESSL